MPKEFLEKVAASPNICAMLDEEQLAEVGAKVIEDYERDVNSRMEWDRETKRAVKLAGLEREVKNFPFENAANIKYPLLAQAVIQFAARTYPQFINNNKAVGFRVVGADKTGQKEDRAKRVADYMSWQLLVQNENWEADTDKLFQLIAMYGTVFRKVYFDPLKRMNVSELCLPEEIVINNMITSLEDARVVSHILKLHTNEVVTKMRSGLFREMDITLLKDTGYTDEGDKNRAEFIEQHRFLDLDKDDYEEPYIVTVHKDSRQVVRIVGRFDLDGIQYNSKEQVIDIKPVTYFTDYHFIPSIIGRYYSTGYGHLLLTLNDIINSIMNLLLDAGTLANTQTILAGRGVRIKSGQLRLNPGEIIKLDATSEDLKKDLIPLTFKEPSPSLFNLLSLLIEAAKDLSSATDVLLGKQPATNVAATTILTLEKQSTQIYSSIQRRLYRSFKKEFTRLFELNRRYMNIMEYSLVVDQPPELIMEDFNTTDFDIAPIADPNLSSDTQKLARVQAEKELLIYPNINPVPIQRNYLRAIDTPEKDIEEILNAPEKPDPKMVKVQGDLIQAQHAMDMEERQFRVDALHKLAEIGDLLASATKNLSDAQHTGVNTNIDAIHTFVESLQKFKEIITPAETEGQSSGTSNEVASVGMGAEPNNTSFEGNPPTA